MTKEIEPLDKIFSNVNEWLKFAEGKSAILTGLIGGAIFGFVNLSHTISITKTWYGNIYFYNCISMLLLGLIVVLFSFIPQTHLYRLPKEKKLNKNPNILFYGDLARMTSEELLNFIFTEKDKSKDIEFKKCFAEQIITNSKIALRKYNYFRISLWFVLSAIFSPVIGIILYLTLDPNSKTVVKNK